MATSFTATISANDAREADVYVSLCVETHDILTIRMDALLAILIAFRSFHRLGTARAGSST